MGGRTAEMASARTDAPWAEQGAAEAFVSGSRTVKCKETRQAHAGRNSPQS